MGEVESLYAKLAEAPEDRTLLSELAGELQRARDPRGELITIEMALADSHAPRPGIRGDDGFIAMTKRRSELLERLAPPKDAGDATWGIGFVKRLDLGAMTTQRLGSAIEAWSHPSLALLRELAIEFHEPWCSLVAVAEHVPRLRRLELSYNDLGGAELATTLALVPQLRSLRLEYVRHAEPFAHTGLHRLELYNVVEGDRLAERLSPANLPMLRELRILLGHTYVDEGRHAMTMERETGDRLLRALAPLLPQLNRLELVMTLDRAGLDALVDGLAGHRLDHLDLAESEVDGLTRASLAAVCNDLVLPRHGADAFDAEYVIHANQPSWGQGRILRRFEGKIEIDFEHAGKRVFMANASFLVAIEGVIRGQ